MKSKSLNTTSVQYITWKQYICQRLTVHVTPDLYVCFANLVPLAFPHNGVHVTTGLYTFDPSFRFTILVTHGLVEHGVEGLLVVAHGHTSTENRTIAERINSGVMEKQSPKLHVARILKSHVSLTVFVNLEVKINSSFECSPYHWMSLERVGYVRPSGL